MLVNEAFTLLLKEAHIIKRVVDLIEMMLPR